MPETPWNGKFAARLKVALDAKGWDYADLSTRLGRTDHSAVHRWLGGKTLPDLPTFAEACRLLGADPKWLLGLDGLQPPVPRIDDASAKEIGAALRAMADRLGGPTR